MFITQTKRVTLDPNVKVHDILSIYNYTPSEISATWFCDEEMDKISERCYNIMQSREAEGRRHRQKYCLRGLEGFTVIGCISKKNNRSASFAAVFEEQARHWNDANEESKILAISSAYRQVTSSCQMWAQAVGWRDQQAVEAYLYEDSDEEEEPKCRILSCLKRTLSEDCILDNTSFFVSASAA